MASELAHYACPDVLEFSGDWEETELPNPDFFKKTLSLITKGFFIKSTEWKLSFTPLNWENNTAQITQMATYKERDEHTWREYGIEQYREGSKEVGVWLKQEKGFISFKVLRPLEKRSRVPSERNNFMEYSGKLFPNKLHLYLDFEAKSIKTKEFYEKELKEYELRLTNL
ncbi:MAG: hypothetical protein ACI85I_002604 [Arenicella sp.]|jgi:hypothetical protein